MAFSDRESNLRIELDVKGGELSAAAIGQLERSLSPLRVLVQDFPVSDLYITIENHARTDDYQVKTSLVLTGRTLFSCENDPHPHPAFERCVTNLVEQVRAYKDSLGNLEERSKFHKGTHQQIVPSQEPDAASLEQAVAAGDYAAFRNSLWVYDETLRKRIGRWIGRYPQMESKLGTELALADLVEAVFLRAFENYGHRPGNLRLGEWFENLIDGAVKDLLQHPEAELENIRFAQSLGETKV